MLLIAVFFDSEVGIVFTLCLNFAKKELMVLQNCFYKKCIANSNGMYLLVYFLFLFVLRNACAKARQEDLTISNN